MGVESLLALLFWLSCGLILYHLALYPLLLALIDRLLAKPVQRSEFLPFISVIVPAYNEAGIIADKLRSIQNSDYPENRIEVIVAEDGSSDDTAHQVLASGNGRVILDHSPQRAGKMTALNRAVQRSHGDILVFTDANALLWPGTLRALLSNFADHSVGLAGGRKLLYGESLLENSEGLYWRYEGHIKTLESRIGSTPAASGELIAIRREIFRPQKGSTINDDFQLVIDTIRSGRRVVYDPSAVTVEKGSELLRDEYGRKSRIAAGRWQLVGQVLRLSWRHPWFALAFFSHKLLRLLVFPLMLAALLSSLALTFVQRTGVSGIAALPGLFSPWAEISLGLQGLFYLLAGLGALLERFGVRVKLLYLLYYFLNAQLAALGGLLQISTRRQTVLWRKVAR